MAEDLFEGLSARMHERVGRNGPCGGDLSAHSRWASGVSDPPRVRLTGPRWNAIANRA